MRMLEREMNVGERNESIKKVKERKECSVLL